MDAATQKVHDALLENWRELRNDGREIACHAAARVVSFAKEADLVTESQRELWALRLRVCPGHEDEGGRDWCAYGCNMNKLRAEGLTS